MRNETLWDTNPKCSGDTLVTSHHVNQSVIGNSEVYSSIPVKENLLSSSGKWLIGYATWFIYFSTVNDWNPKQCKRQFLLDHLSVVCILKNQCVLLKGSLMPKWTSELSMILSIYIKQSVHGEICWICHRASGVLQDSVSCCKTVQASGCSRKTTNITTAS